jgi:hypothetical protein
MLPPNGSSNRRPLPSAGSIGPVPPRHRYYEALRPPAIRLAALRCLCLVIPPLRPICSQRPGRTTVGSGELLFRFPSRKMSVEMAGSPRFLGNPCVPMPCSRTPVGPRTPGHCGASTWPPLESTTKAPAIIRFRGSITRPWDWLSTLRSGGYPTPRKTRFRLLGQAWPGGILLPAGLLRKVSEFEAHTPFPKLSWRYDPFWTL